LPRSMAALLWICCLASTLGCAGFSDFRNDQVDRRKARNQQTSRVDSMWKQGYGFNNPNNDRPRQGLNPVNFDGKTDRERRDKGGYFSDLFGDMFVHGVKSTFTAIASKFRR
jgi:hypothetical protein